MYKYFIFILVSLVFFSCSQKEDGLKLEAGTETYNFAKELSENFPALDPDKNILLVETTRFNVNAGDVFDALFKNFSNQLDKLKNLDSTRLKKIFNDNASLIAEKKMIITAAKDKSFEVSDVELDSIIQLQYKKAGGKEKFEKFMKSKNISLDYIYDDYKNSILIQKFLKDLVKDSIQINQEDIQKQLMQIRSVSVRHILLKTTGLNESQKKAKRNQLSQILQRKKNGESFSVLAKKYSEDSGTANNGGLIKNIKPGDMVQPFDNIAFSLGIGEVSEIFETQFGYHILTVIDRKREDRSPMQIEKELKEIKQKQLLPNVIKTLRKEFEFKEYAL